MCARRWRTRSSIPRRCSRRWPPTPANGHIANGAFARQLSNLHERPISANVWGVQKNTIGYRLYITDAHGIVRYDSSGRAVGQDYSRWNDVYRTLRGGTARAHAQRSER